MCLELQDITQGSPRLSQNEVWARLWNKGYFLVQSRSSSVTYLSCWATSRVLLLQLLQRFSFCARSSDALAVSQALPIHELVIDRFAEIVNAEPCLWPL